jgi:hypothetical protein
MDRLSTEASGQGASPSRQSSEVQTKRVKGKSRRKRSRSPHSEADGSGSSKAHPSAAAKLSRLRPTHNTDVQSVGRASSVSSRVAARSELSLSRTREESRAGTESAYGYARSGGSLSRQSGGRPSLAATLDAAVCQERRRKAHQQYLDFQTAYETVASRGDRSKTEELLDCFADDTVFKEEVPLPGAKSGGGSAPARPSTVQSTSNGVGSAPTGNPAGVEREGVTLTDGNSRPTGQGLRAFVYSCTACDTKIGTPFAAGAAPSMETLQDVYYHCGTASHRRLLRVLFPEQPRLRLDPETVEPDPERCMLIHINGIPTLVSRELGGGGHFTLGRETARLHGPQAGGAGEGGANELPEHRGDELSDLAGSLFNPLSQFASASFTHLRARPSQALKADKLEQLEAPDHLSHEVALGELSTLPTLPIARRASYPTGLGSMEGNIASLLPPLAPSMLLPTVQALLGASSKSTPAGQPSPTSPLAEGQPQHQPAPNPLTSGLEVELVMKRVLVKTSAQGEGGKEGEQQQPGRVPRVEEVPEQVPIQPRQVVCVRDIFDPAAGQATQGKRRAAPGVEIDIEPNLDTRLPVSDGQCFRLVWRVHKRLRGALSASELKQVGHLLQQAVRSAVGSTDRTESRGRTASNRRGRILREDLLLRDDRLSMLSAGASSGRFAQRMGTQQDQQEGQAPHSSLEEWLGLSLPDPTVLAPYLRSQTQTQTQTQTQRFTGQAP